MKKYYFEIQFLNHSEIHWTRDTTVDNARDSMWDKYKKAITITFIYFNDPATTERKDENHVYEQIFPDT